MGQAVPRGSGRHRRAASGVRDAGGRRLIEEIFRGEWSRAVAIVARATGSLDRAEDAVQDAFLAAASQWPRDGVPRSPGAWIVATARNRAIDRLRREEVQARLYEEITALSRIAVTDDEDDVSIPDERLALIFTCCHPALAVDAQVALTLRLVGGLATPQIASAFLSTEEAMTQRLVRAKRRVRDIGIPIRIPPDEALTDRLDGVLAVIYLIFNAGYTGGVDQQGVAAEAIRLGSLLAALMPDEAEVLGLLALMTLHHARRHTRVGDDGGILLLDEQDRSRWDEAAISRGVGLLARAMLLRRPGRYQLHAAIAALHAEAPSFDATDWAEIRVAYERLRALHDSPVIALNHAVAVAMVDGPEAGLVRMEALAVPLDGYYLLHAGRADLLRRCGRDIEAWDAYTRALALGPSDAEQLYLTKRRAALRCGP